VYCDGHLTSVLVVHESAAETWHLKGHILKVKVIKWRMKCVRHISHGWDTSLYLDVMEQTRWGR